LNQNPVQQKSTPAASTWGRNGYAEHWINPKTDWMWRPLHESAARMRQAVGRAKEKKLAALDERVLRQAGRELLLAQASDWPFIITDGTTEQYARRRFDEHLNRFHHLLNHYEGGTIDEQKLSTLEYMDAIFPELDYELFAQK
jgi:1,4-alpha-glucan branching enzyme